MATGLTSADLVWNRALSDEPGNGFGDRHLHAMAKPYGRIMSSGTSAVADTCTVQEILGAADAFDYLGLSDQADLTRRLADADFSNGREQRRNRAFYGLELALHRAFERRYEAAPEDFDPPLPASSGSPTQPDGTQPSARSPKSCSGTVIVHELDNPCTLGAGCARLSEGLIEHERAALHRSSECELCPSGRDWAR